jgi:predicted glycoside hydrolase/deacetylase ChbG (UPF0249 family)
MRNLIINADGYGFTAGITRAIEECVEFGTVRSLSANVNFAAAEGLVSLVRRHPSLSVGCHINPVVGSPLLNPSKVPSLVDENGEFLYRNFRRNFLGGRMRPEELRAEMIAQIERTRELAGPAFSHVDFHMGLHRLPGLYPLFLEVAEKSGAGRMRTHRYRVGLENRFPRLKNLAFMLGSPARIPKYLWNRELRRRASGKGMAMPDRRVEITDLGLRSDVITLANYLALIRNLPHGFNEFVVHPGYVDPELRRWSSWVEPRELERQALVSPEFRAALQASDVNLAGYRDIPLKSRDASSRSRDAAWQSE